MEEVMNKFQQCLDTWNDLPRYVYSEEYKGAFMNFAKKAMDMGKIIGERFVVMTLHHETDGRLPYFDFDRSSLDERDV